VVLFPDNSFALTATGTAEILGVGTGLSITATLTARINTSGRAVNETVTIPESGSVQVQFTTTARIEQFGGDATIDIGGVVVMQATGVVFTREPTRRVLVNAPNVSLSIMVPDGEGTREAFSISGAARFAFGGGMGFRLEDLRVNGFAIFGVGATLTAPAPLVTPPVADLLDPTDGQVVDRGAYNTSHTIDVVFTSYHASGLDESSIMDSGGELLMTVDGVAPAGLTVSGTPTRINESTFRYSFTGTLPAGQVQILFRPGLLR